MLTLIAITAVLAQSVSRQEVAPPVVSPAAPQEAPPRVQRTEYEVFYHHVVRNKTDRELKDVIVYVPVPESDEYQQVEGFRIERRVPVHISNRTDAFGTRIKRVAVSSLPPGSEVEIGFSCVVRLGPPVRVSLDAPKARQQVASDLEPVPAAIRDLYLRDHNIFGLADPAIKERADKLLRDYPDPVDRARAIHDLVASTLRYKGGDGWDPAPEVLKRGAGSCSEFAYVFCALCRATGIPTRFVGASIFPRDSKAPFQDHGNHRWAEAYLPARGWVPFDPTLDRAKPAKQDFVGTHHGRTFIVTRTGDKSLQLGLSYVGANSHNGETTRTRWFTWSQGTAARLEAAIKLRDAGRHAEAERALHEIVKDSPGTRAAWEATGLLERAPPVHGNGAESVTPSSRR